MVTGGYPWFVRPSNPWEPKRYRWIVPDLIGVVRPGECAGYTWTRAGAALDAGRAMADARRKAAQRDPG